MKANDSLVETKPVDVKVVEVKAQDPLEELITANAQLQVKFDRQAQVCEA